MKLPPFPRRLVVLGATGSIGRKALAVVARYPDRFRVVGLSAGRDAAALAELVASSGARHAVLADPAGAAALRDRVGSGVSVEAGGEAVAALAAREDVDLVVNGTVGRAGLEASLVAVESGKMLALANKESLVLAGDLLMDAARRSGAAVIPVDSEHSGLFQCLHGRPAGDVNRVFLTASGGPFRGWRPERLATVTPEEALRHPVWPMGPRITVDSATLFNKGLEVIETRALFGIPIDRIHVWVHPQSAVHALVEWRDGSLLAQVSAPDMMMPVQYAMTFPERLDCEAPRGDLPHWGTLEFADPDREAFPALDLAYAAGTQGGTAPTILNAADEVAVAAFLDRRLSFPGITDVLRETLSRVPLRAADSLAAIDAADREAREAATALVRARAS